MDTPDTQRQEDDTPLHALDTESPDEATAEEAPQDVQARRMRLKVLFAAGLFVLLLAGAVAYLYLPGASSEGEAGSLPVYRRGIAGTATVKLEAPTAVAVSPDGRVYVNDGASRGIRVFDASGNHLFSFGSIKDGEATKLQVPVHIAVDSQGDVYVTDRKLRALYVFDPDGRFLRKFPAPDDTWSPIGVAVDDDGTVFVTDVGDPAKHRVIVFDALGRQLAEFGRTKEVKEARESVGSFYFPNAIALRDDLVFVADSNNRRVQVFDRSGAFKYLISTGGIARGIAFDARGHLLVVDTLANEVDAYDALEGGRKLYSLGGAGTGRGQFQFPNDVAVDPAGRLYVADRGNDQVQVWSMPGQGEVASGFGLWPWALLALPLLALPLALLKRRSADTISLTAEESDESGSNENDEATASADDRSGGPLSDIA